MRLVHLASVLAIAASLLGACEHPLSDARYPIFDDDGNCVRCGIGTSRPGPFVPGDTIVAWVWETLPGDTLVWWVLGENYRIVDGESSGKPSTPRDTARIIALRPGTGSIVAAVKGRGFTYSRLLQTREPTSPAR